MSKPDAPKFVTALFSFKGKNNDELCFKKGDIITITQTDDEGWWEGTLHDKTGWFPSNYVKEHRVPDNGLSPVKVPSEKGLQESPVHQKLNRDIVIKDIVDSERVNVAELQGLVNNFLQPLESTNILKKEEYKQLLGNIHEVLEMHQRLLTSLEATVLQGIAARIGNLFLTLAPRLKSIHTAYCNNHPQAVCILDRYRDELNEFMEDSGAISPGILVLTTGLSKPFRRLDKYSAMLQELERYTEKNHPDRGDTQRSIAVYREIADTCSSIRKQRELALQVLTSGIKGWEGEELSSLGEILHVGSVTLATGVDKRDRYFVLFPTTLLVLSTSARMSSFIYEGKLPLTGINVVATEDTDDLRNAFEITGPMIENITVLCATKEERQRWIELLVQEQGTNVLKSPTMPRVSYNHPPYTRLSRYFAKLVRKKIIEAELMKKLLYIQYVLKPDLSSVKMRRCNVTYTIFPKKSSEYVSDGETITDNENVQSPPQKLRKSTLTLDVRYQVGDTDLRTLGVESTSSLTNFASRAAYGDRSTFETSKSLPAGPPTSHVLPNILLSTSNSVVPILLPRTHDYYRENLDVPRERMRCGATIKCWDVVELCPKIPDISNLSVRDSVTNVNRVDNENVSDGQRACPTTSLHSTDSGMAESYRLNSTELGSCYKSHRCSHSKCIDPVRTSHSESEIDENKFEHQCICTSPFGSTPRNSGRSFPSSENINKTMITVKPSSSDIKRDVKDAFENTEGEKEKSTVVLATRDYENIKHKRFTEPVPHLHQSHTKRGGRRMDFMLIGGSRKQFHCRDAQNEMNNQMNGKRQRSAVDHSSLSPGIKTPWSIASLRPAPPLYTLKTFDERQFEDDAIILKVIESYCLSVNSRFTMNSSESNSMMDLEWQRTRDGSSSTHNRSTNWDTRADRSLSETVKTLKNQMTDLQSQMSLLTKQLDEERRSRLSLAATVKRSMAVIDGSMS
ncbi:hypothetical protein KPH14_001166 [Odynerus spinipes]|uniref:Rho guanine nucleotide exchange factor 7 n=1 Tax=Odynerus spinipes TaxID=1348599 RepID=A0AAD9VRX0_9HYME|nr:hypothetical protein KPH14_001166 [Odynerus spinipes]